MRIEEELICLEKAAQAASQICLNIAKDFSHEDLLRKSDHSPVTLADFCSQIKICQIIESYFPQDPIVAEENIKSLEENPKLLQKAQSYLKDIDLKNMQAQSSCKSYGRFWCVDPIDGTAGFLKKEHYAIAIALIEDETVIAAALVCNGLGKLLGSEEILYLGHKQKKMIEKIDLQTQKRSYLQQSYKVPAREDIRICISPNKAHSCSSQAKSLQKKIKSKQAPLAIHGQCKYACLLENKAQLYWRKSPHHDYKEKIWDHAAGTFFLEKIQGHICDLEGRPLDFSQVPELKNNQGLLACPQELFHLLKEDLLHA